MLLKGMKQAFDCNNDIFGGHHFALLQISFLIELNDKLVPRSQREESQCLLQKDFLWKTISFVIAE